MGKRQVLGIHEWIERRSKIESFDLVSSRLVPLHRPVAVCQSKVCHLMEERMKNANSWTFFSYSSHEHSEIASKINKSSLSLFLVADRSKEHELSGEFAMFFPHLFQLCRPPLYKSGIKNTQERGEFTHSGPLLDSIAVSVFVVFLAKFDKY